MCYNLRIYLIALTGREVKWMMDAIVLHLFQTVPTLCGANDTLNNVINRERDNRRMDEVKSVSVICITNNNYGFDVLSLDVEFIEQCNIIIYLKAKRTQ